MAAETTRKNPIAVFMAFGTKGDVYPVAAIAAAFASDQKQYEVAFVTHSAHEQDNDTGGSTEVSFSLQKKEITRKHRQECLSTVERIYGEGPIMDGDLIIINFFALEGWSLAELFHVRCVVAAPYVVPYSAPSSFERQFRNELPLLYKYLQEAPTGKIGWEDVIHRMWPLFTEDWGEWRSVHLKLSFLPLTDPVTGLPTWHDRPSSPLLLYGFSQEVVECPEILSLISLRKLNAEDGFLCSSHAKIKSFLDSSAEQPIFISLSSVAGYGPLDDAIKIFAHEPSSDSEHMQASEIQTSLFDDRLFCFSGEMPYSLLFPRCTAVIHHDGSGSTAAALRAGIPQDGVSTVLQIIKEEIICTD